MVSTTGCSDGDPEDVVLAKSSVGLGYTTPPEFLERHLYGTVIISLQNKEHMENRKLDEQDKNKVKTALIIVVLVAGAGQLGWLTYFGIEPLKFGLEGIIPPPDDVFFKVNVKEDLGAYASEDVIVNAYTKSGSTYTYFDSATASSGIATFSGTSLPEGSHIWLQARQAAPASADGYITPIREFIVGQGDATDTVSVKDAITGESTLWVSNLHDSTEPIFSFEDIAGNSLSAGTADNLTTGDTHIIFTISIAEDECNYGAPDFTDVVNGDVYIGGIWVVLRTATDSYTFEQGSARYMHTWQDLTYEYYAFNFNVHLWQDSLRTGDINSFTTNLKLADGADFDGGANVWSMDVFDMMKVTSSIAIGDFIDGGALAPAAVVAYCD